MEALEGGEQRQLEGRHVKPMRGQEELEEDGDVHDAALAWVSRTRG